MEWEWPTRESHGNGISQKLGNGGGREWELNRWEWDGMGMLTAIPAHLYLCRSCRHNGMHVLGCRNSQETTSGFSYHSTDEFRRVGSVDAKNLNIQLGDTGLAIPAILTNAKCLRILYTVVDVVVVFVFFTLILLFLAKYLTACAHCVTCLLSPVFLVVWHKGQQQRCGSPDQIYMHVCIIFKSE